MWFSGLEPKAGGRAVLFCALIGIVTGCLKEGLLKHLFLGLSGPSKGEGVAQG